MTDQIVQFKLQTQKLNEDEVFENLDQPTNFQHHHVIDVLTPNPLISTSVSAGMPLASQNKLEYLNCEDILYDYYKNIIEKNGKKCIIIVDLTNFPEVSTRIDIRDQTIIHKDDTDQFSKDVKHYYQTYNPEKEALFIMVNLHINHTGLILHQIEDK